MLASTERSLEIERQRRSQLQRVDPLLYSRPSGHRAEASTGFCRPRSSEKFAGCRTPHLTFTAVARDVCQSVVAGLNNAQQPTKNDSTSCTAGDTRRTDERKLKNADRPTKRVRVRHHDSVINDSSATKGIPDVVAKVGAASPNCDAPKRQANQDMRMTEDHSRFLSRRWSSLKELSSNQSAGVDRSDSSNMPGGRRTSRLDRHVYQCYFAGILHSSRRSERFVRLQQLYAALEHAVEIETEMLSLRQRATSEATTDQDEYRLPDSTDVTDPFLRKHWRQRSQELQKLYAQLDAAQGDKEFFYDNGHLNAFQWKSWRDLGLSKKSSTLAKLKALYEEAVADGRSATASRSTQLQRVERGLSYRKLLGTFRRLENRSRKEAEAWLRWQSTSQHSMASERKLDGTYMKMMESAARNAKALALHGYHMHEHRNRYDAYVQSRRIYRPKSAPNIFEQPSSDEQLETEDVDSSDQTTSTRSFYDNSCYCTERGEEPPAKPKSSLTDSSQILSPMTSVDSVTKYAVSGKRVDTCTEASCAPEKETVSVEVAAAVKQFLPEAISFDEKLTQRRVSRDSDPDAGVNEPDKIGSRSKQKSRRRERQRPRCRNENAAETEKRTDIRGAATLDSVGRRHIEAWRRTSRPLSGTLNQALAYFNSLCINDSNDKTNSQSIRCDDNSDSAVSQNKSRETRGQTISTETSSQFTSASTDNEDVPVKQLAEHKEKLSIVNSDESVAVPDRGKVMLPQFHPCRDEVNAAEFPSSNVSSRSLAMCFRAVNIDKHCSQSKVDTTERSSQEYAKKTEGQTTDTQPTKWQNDVTIRPEICPTYVRSAPIVHMRSESQPIQTTSVSSPVFVDWKQADVCKLPTLIGQRSADRRNLKLNDWIVSPASNSPACVDERLSRNLLYSDWSTLDEVVKQTANKSRCAKDKNGTSAESATQTKSLPEDTPRAENNAMYVTTIDSSSIICRRCCRSLAACSCVSTAETGARRRYESKPDIVNHADLYRLDDDYGIKSASLRFADSLVPSASRHHGPMAGTFHVSQRRPRPEQSQQDVEMRRMMTSLETIDSEWTNCRPTRRSQQPVHSTLNMNNNDNISRSSSSSNNNNNSPPLQWKTGSSNVDQRQLASSGNFDQREIYKLTVMHTFARNMSLLTLVFTG